MLLTQSGGNVPVNHGRKEEMLEVVVVLQASSHTFICGGFAPDSTLPVAAYAKNKKLTDLRLTLRYPQSTSVLK